VAVQFNPFATLAYQYNHVCDKLLQSAAHGDQAIVLCRLHELTPGKVEVHFLEERLTCNRRARYQAQPSTPFSVLTGQHTDDLTPAPASLYAFWDQPLVAANLFVLRVSYKRSAGGFYGEKGDFCRLLHMTSPFIVIPMPILAIHLTGVTACLETDLVLLRNLI
jgi:hypothetical protein